MSSSRVPVRPARGAGVRIDAVDFFYAAIPEVTLDADGSQDALLVRVRAGDQEGWGECEASPLTSIAAFATPRSHGACQPVEASVVGQVIRDQGDILALDRLVRRNSMDLLQAVHTWSGIEMALWDILGKMRGEPVWALLGHDAALPKLAYASVLFGDTPEETARRARVAADAGFGAVKFGWGPFGRRSVADDALQLDAAREGFGRGRLMVDAGQAWADDPDAAMARIDPLRHAEVDWLEEPFGPDEYALYAALAERAPDIALAGGEAAHTTSMAVNLMRYGGIRFVQIDSGRIGGIGPSHAVAEFAAAHGVTYVNHTFTSHLALSASLQSYAGIPSAGLAEYPASLSDLAQDLVANPLGLTQGVTGNEVSAPDGPGLGVDVDLRGIAPFLRSVEIAVDGVPLVHTDRDGAVRTAGAPAAHRPTVSGA
jgi:L-alanine-DL-glutamate epimerase-like enolase superfamily enzyme